MGGLKDHMDVTAILNAVKAQDLRLVRFLYCDNAGIIRGKVAYYPTLPDRLVSGIGLTVAMQAMNSLDQLQTVDGMGPVGEIRLVPDLATFRPLPWAPGTAALLTNMVTLAGEPWDACPRTFLARMDQAARQAGLVIQASIENEFTLLDATGAVLDDTLCFASTGMLATESFVADLAHALEAQGIMLEQYYPELAPGQHEISVRHRPVIQAADQQIYVRETVRAVAARHGWQVSFAPKPFLGQAGNGGHVHLSAVDADGRNLLADPADPYGLSPTGYHFLAGILEHLPALLALTTPTVNSYQRLGPDTWSSGYACWGPDNREAPLRVASPMRTKPVDSINLEFKPADLASNPYLVLGALIAAGLDGLVTGRDPGPATTDNPARLTDRERDARGIRRLPTSLDQALDALEADRVLLTALGPLLARSYLAVKRSEAAFYRDRSPEEVASLHRLRY
jgi:glutamine synthetase